VGHLREILTADAVARALREKGAEATLNYIADSFDPLRKVYPFLDGSYEEHVGKPLCSVPCPCGEHASYADHFLAPFLGAVRELGVEVTVLLSHLQYEKGLYVSEIFDALEARDRIAAILKQETGKECEAGWSPFRPLCPSCGRLSDARVTGWDREANTIAYACGCGSEGDVSAVGGGKLAWRVDWPARWRITGCTFEPFGKDHATAGGSWDTGKRISPDVFGYPAPDHVVYEWFALRGGGDMASSKGNVLAVEELLEVLPPEVLRFLVMDKTPNRSAEVDAGEALFTLVSRYDRSACDNPDGRPVQLSRVTGLPPCPVPFQHLVTSVQVADARFRGAECAAGEWEEEVFAVLDRSGYHVPEGEAREAVRRRAWNARRWVERYAPEESRFEVQEDLPAAVGDLPGEERGWLRELAGELEDGLDAEGVHKRIHDVKDRLDLPAKALFRAVYTALLGKESGPRAGHLIAALGVGWVRERLREAGEA
jgi:lysyl-tRNA synthetase class 1